MGAFVSLLDPYPRNQPDFATNRLNALKIQDAQQQVDMNPSRAQILQNQAKATDMANQQAQMQMDLQKRMTQWQQDAFGGSSQGTGPNDTSSQKAAPQNTFTSSTPDQLAGLNVLNPASAANGGTLHTSMAPINPPAASTPAAQRPQGTPSSEDPWQRAFASAPKYGIPPSVLIPLQESYLKLKQGYATLTKDQQAAEQAKIEAYGAQTKALLGISDPDQRQAYWENVSRPALLNAGYKDQELNTQTSLGNEALWAHLRAANAMKGVHSSVTEDQNSAAKVLGNVTTKAEWDQKMETLARTIDPTVLQQFGGWDEDAPQRARALGMTVSEQVKAPGEQAKANSEVYANDVQTVRNAAASSTDKDASYAAVSAALDQMPHGRAKRFTLPPKDQYDPQQFADQVNSSALTPKEKTTADNAQARLNQTITYDNARLLLQQQANDIRKQTANRANTADQRQAQGEIYKLEGSERDLNMRLDRVKAALQGDMYLTPGANGKLAPTSTLTPDQQKAARADLQAQFNGLTDQLKSTIASKYSQYARLGVTPQYPLGDVNSAIDAGRDSVLNPKKAGTQPKPGAPGKPASTPAATANNNQPGGRIRVKLSDGRTGSVDAADFDPSSMTKLPQ